MKLFRKRNLLILAVLVVAALAAWQMLKPKQTGPQVAQSAPVERGTVRKLLSATGIVKSQVGAAVKTGTRATGVIRVMHVRVGDTVTRGQIIAEIDDRELRAQIAQGEAGVQSAESELARTRQSYPLQIKEAEAKLEAAAAEADYAKVNLNRRRILVEQDLDARNSLDEATQLYETKVNAQKAAKATLERLRAEYTLNVRIAEDSLAQAKAELEAVRIRLSYTKIVSPMDGVVSQVAAQEGETVVAGFQVANLITVIDPLRLEMWIYVDETDVGQVRQGMAVEYNVDSLPGKVFSGSVDQIYPEPEVRDNIVYFRALVKVDKDTAAFLRPEMTTQCRIVVEVKENVVSLPNNALKWVDGEQVVYVRQPDGSWRTASPRLGLQGAERSEVLGGVSEGDVVATRLVVATTVTMPGNMR